MRRVASLWMGGSLSFLEQLCLKSFVDVGHPVRLYRYEDIPNAPAGVELADASDILPARSFLRHGRTNSTALHSDLFRYHMLDKLEGTIWVDTDAYCVKPFEAPTGHFFAWESGTGVNGGVLGLPQDSPALAALLAFTRDEYAIPVWYDETYRRSLEKAAAEDRPVHVSEQPWGVWGPHALTHFLKQSGEIAHAMPRVALYPFAYEDRRLMLRPNLDASQYVTDETYSIHFYGRRMRSRILSKEPGGVPRPRSLVGQLLKRHGIDPLLAPLPARKGPPSDADDDDGAEA